MCMMWIVWIVDSMGWDGMGIGVCVVFAGEEWDDEWDEDMRT